MKSRIDKARELGYPDAEIARRIGVGRSYICHVAAGRKCLSPHCEALLAELVGDDPTEALKEATVAQAREPMRSRLRAALFSTGVRGAASLCAWLALLLGAMTPSHDARAAAWPARDNV